MKARIAILCSDSVHHNYLLGIFCERFDVVGIVREPVKEQRRRLFANRLWRDYICNIYNACRHNLLGYERFRRAYFSDAPPLPPDVPVIEVCWINGPVVAEFLSEIKPNIVVVMGISLLNQETLNSAGDIWINLHGGYLPDYRGNNCFFFAVYNRDFHKIGSTIHHLSLGIDTGDIIEIAVPPIYPSDNSEKLYCRAEKLAIHRLAYWIDHYQNCGMIPQYPQKRRGDLYLSRDRTPIIDLKFCFRVLTRRVRMPERTNPLYSPVNV